MKVKAKLNKVFYSKGDFSIASFEPMEVYPELIVDDTYATFKVKGNLGALSKDITYNITLGDEETNNYGTTYSLIFVAPDVDLHNSRDLDNFMQTLCSKKRWDAIKKAIDNPLEAIQNGDVEALMKADNVGKATAEKIVEKFATMKDYSAAFEFMIPLGLTSDFIQKVCRYYKNADVAVQKIKENPYQLMTIAGVGFTKCDDIYKEMGLPHDGFDRVFNYIKYILESKVSDGHTYITPDELKARIVNDIPSVSDQKIRDCLQEGVNNGVLMFTNDMTRLALKKYYSLEYHIAKELARLVKAESKVTVENYMDIIVKQQEKQGWFYRPKQLEAISNMFANNVYLVEGYAGTGKTAVSKVVLEILESYGYIYATCALSGRAAQNMALVTGRDSSTIHRLLSFNPETMKFTYNKESKLPYDIILIDEISMVSADIFLALIQSIKDGAKLIFLGDSAQLEAIGISILKPMIESNVIPKILLDEIHRQAEESAIVEHSIAMRDGKIMMPSRPGVHTFGLKKDLTYYNLPNDDHVADIAEERFKKAIKEYNIQDIQMLGLTRDKGVANCLDMSKRCQEIYNPASPSKEEVEVGYGSKSFLIREGDKVINIKNNYNAKNIDDDKVAVFNGSIGIVEAIEEDKNGDTVMIINFDGIGEIVFSEAQFNNLNLGYCFSIHRAQGGQWGKVILALPFHFMLSGNELAYSGITRPQYSIDTVTCYKSFSHAVRTFKAEDKKTYLAELLQNELK